MLKYIHRDFEIDLSNRQVHEQEENNYFLDRIFTKFTFPFTFDLTDELREKMNLPDSDNIDVIEILYEGFYVHFSKTEKAVLEISSINGNKVEASINYGSEELATSTKKLSELDLDHFEFEGDDDIYDHAENVVDQTWPDVSHSFPSIHYDGADLDEDQFESFTKIINRYSGGEMYRNTFDEVENKPINRNIVHPFVYLMHILKKGFEEAGYYLSGEFVNHEIYSKLMLIHFSDYYIQTELQQEDHELRTNEFTGSVNNIVGQYSKSIALPEAGRYLVTGNVFLRVRGAFGSHASGMSFVYKGQNIWQRDLFSLTTYREELKTVNFYIDYEPGDGDLVLGGMNLKYGRVGDIDDYEALIADVRVTQVAKFDADGNIVPTVSGAADIDLRRAVPDITFGELLTVIKNWWNLEIYPVEDQVRIDFVQSRYRNSKIIDITDIESPFPLKEFNRKDKFLLQHQEVESDTYNYKKIFVSEKGLDLLDETPKDDEVMPIEVNALPLPVIVRKDSGSPFNPLNILRRTAHLFSEAKDKVTFVVYPGLTSGRNITLNDAAISLETSYINHHQEWLQFRINARTYKWEVVCTEERLTEILTTNRFKSYNRIHVPKIINKRNVYNDVWVVEFECLS